MNEMTYNKLIKCIKKVCGNELDEINAGSRLQEDLGMGSLQLVMLEVELEEAFCFTFDPLDDFKNIFRTVESLCNYLERKVI